MQRHTWIPALLDCVGAAGLIGAAVALGGARWFTDALPEGLFFQAFYVCFAVAVGALTSARVFAISRVIAHTPNPRRQRAAAAAPPPPQPQLPPGDEPAPSKLQRAA